jgi:hypothetical protein
VSHDLQHVDSLVFYPDHGGNSEVVTANVENEFLGPKVIGCVERFLNLSIVLPLSSPGFGHPIVEGFFGVRMFFDKPRDRPGV